MRPVSGLPWTPRQSFPRQLQTLTLAELLLLRTLALVLPQPSKLQGLSAQTSGTLGAALAARRLMLLSHLATAAGWPCWSP